VCVLSAVQSATESHLKVSDGVCIGCTKITYFMNVLNNSCYPSEGKNPSFGDVN
jgi:hypothetical protein